MKRNLKWWVICLVLLIHTVSFGQTKLDRQKLDRFLTTLEENNKAMLSLSLLKDGEIVYERSIGYASLEEQVKTNSETKFRIGSISKVFTTVMIFQLIEEGKLSLDTKLSKFYPKVKNADKIIISHLLNHSSGIFNMTNAPSFRAFMTSPKTKAEMVEHIEGLDSDFEPGTQSSYSNSGFVLLGFIVEDLTGSDYPTQVKKRIADKIGLKRTNYGKETDISANEAHSFQINNGAWVQSTIVTDMSIPGGAGAMVSTPTDLTYFIKALFDGKLISQASLDKMKEVNGRMGHGLFAIPFNDKTAYGHGGAIDRFLSELAYFEEEDLAIALTMNGVNYSKNDILIGALSIAFGLPYDIPDFSAKAISLSEEQLKKYEGVFASADVPLEITLSAEGGVLKAQATGQGALSLTAFSEREFRFEQAGIVIVFDTQESKQESKVDFSTFVLNQGGGKFTFKKK